MNVGLIEKCFTIHDAQRYLITLVEFSSFWKRHFKAGEAIEISSAYEAENQKRKLFMTKSIVYKIVVDIICEREMLQTLINK